MNLITKIAIVVLVVAALINAAVTIKLATEPINWKTECKRLEGYANQLEQTAKQYEIGAGRANVDLGNARASAVAEQLQLREQIDVLAEQKLRLEKENQDNNKKLDLINTEITKANEIAKAADTRASNLEKTSNELRETIKAREGEVRNLDQALTAARAEVERLERVDRVLREMLEGKERQLKELERQLVIAQSGATSDVGENTIGVRPAKINGEISAVDATTNMASVNIGATQGVTTGMKLIVYRGGDFVGYLEVVQVSQTDAAGKIVDQQLPPTKGDKVTNNLQD